MNFLLIGSHVKMTKNNNYLIGSITEAIQYDSNTFMIYTSSPRIYNNKPKLIDLKIEEFKKLLKIQKIEINNLVIHASYLINLANTINNNVYKSSLELLKDEIYRAMKIGIKILVLHPGSSVGGDINNSLMQLAKGINIILKEEDDIKIAIETMAGKGNEIGRNFDQLKIILDNIILKNKVGVCLDTCHLNDAGYDIKSNFESVLLEFDNKIGIKKIFAIHLNDSKNILNSNKDRHENIGYGNIGFEALLKIAYHPKLQNVPKILETPYFDQKPLYKYEITNFKKKQFNKFK